MSRHGALVMGAFVGLLIAARTPCGQAQVKARIENLLWKLPAIGRAAEAVSARALLRTIGIAAAGGTPSRGAADELRAAPSLLPTRLVAASRSVSEGRPVSESMEANT